MAFRHTEACPASIQVVSTQFSDQPFHLKLGLVKLLGIVGKERVTEGFGSLDPIWGELGPMSCMFGTCWAKLLFSGKSWNGCQRPEIKLADKDL